VSQDALTLSRPRQGASARPAVSTARRVLLGQVGCLLLFLAVLQALVQSGLVSPLFLSAPSVVLPLFLSMVPAELLGLAFQTLLETAIALVLAGAIGVLAGYALWRFSTVGVALEGMLTAVFATPLILLYPIMLVLFGRTSNAVVAVAVVTSIIPIALNTRAAFAHVSPVLVKAGRSLGLAERGIFRQIMLPAAAPGIFSGLRLGLGYIFKATLLMEFIVNIGGLGRRAAVAYDLLDIPRLYASILAVVVLSVVFLFLLNRSERLLKRG
jgi:NitT/TauT family transport system permease protein